MFCDCHWNCIIFLVPMMEARSKVFDLLQISEKDESLKSETVTLARLYYKFTNQWRREKCLGDMKQVTGFCSSSGTRLVVSLLEC